VKGLFAFHFHRPLPAREGKANVMADERAEGESDLRCARCGKLLNEEDRDRSECHSCRSPYGKLADLDIAIRAGGDSPDRIKEWPAIRHVLREHFGAQYSAKELWERFTDLMHAGRIDPEVYLRASFATVMQWLAVATLNAKSTPITPERDDDGNLRLPGWIERKHGLLLDQIHLGRGNMFPISTSDAKIVDGDTPAVCPKTDRPVGAEWLPTILSIYRRCGMVGPAQTIHWVGGQLRLENVCTCFGVGDSPGPSNVDRGGRTVIRAEHEQRRLIAERWEFFKAGYKTLGFPRVSMENFATWSSDHFDDMPTDNPVQLRVLVDAYRKTPNPRFSD
jgi:hypothetical protein